MAQQQQLILAEFIEKVKRESYRKDDPYFLDDDSVITTNRGNKLNRSAKYVRQGRLNSNALFQQRIEYAGYKRDVISINPQFYTPEGDVVEDDEDIDEEDEPLDENVYKDIKLEDILAPLSSAADLPSHPSLSQPYKEQGLEEMIKNAEEQLHKQQDILYTIKKIYTGFRGDVTWVPLSLFEDAEGDRILGRPAEVVHNDGDAAITATAPTNGDPSATAQQAATENQVVEGSTTDADMTDHPAQLLAATNGNAAANEDTIGSTERTGHASAAIQSNGEQIRGGPVYANGINSTENGARSEHAALSEVEATADGSAESVVLEDAESPNAPSHRMTTRRQVNQNTRTPSPVRSVSPVSYVPPIHPFFSFPPSTTPDPAMGLPQKMADETTLALSTYISKQEEIVRQLQDLHLGLLRALKMRQDVWKWTRAEGHVGEMSDNEDWVDLEDWGIDPRDTRIKYTKGQQEEDQADEEEERRGKRVRRAGRTKE